MSVLIVLISKMSVNRSCMFQKDGKYQVPKIRSVRVTEKMGNEITVAPSDRATLDTRVGTIS